MLVGEHHVHPSLILLQAYLQGETQWETGRGSAILSALKWVERIFLRSLDVVYFDNSVS